MINQTRNELLSLLYYVKNGKTKFELDNLLMYFEEDIKRKLEDLEEEKGQLLEDLKILEYVKDKIKESEDMGND